MTKPVFKQLYFHVEKEAYYEVLENPDKGFGFSIELKESQLSDMQMMVFDFLVKCYKKKILGYIQLSFGTSAVGEMHELNRTVEKIIKKDKSYIISTSY